MSDLARFRIAIIVALKSLGVGQRGERSARKLRMDVERLQRGDKAVLAEQRGKPGNSAGSQIGISSLMDTWLLLQNVEFDGERNRTLYVIKSRGMKHSNQVREFLLSDQGIDLVDVYVGADRVLTGAARVAQEARERAAAELRRQDHQRRLQHLNRRQKAIEAQIAALQAEAASEAAEVDYALAQQSLLETAAQQTARTMALLRGVETDSNGGTGEL